MVCAKARTGLAWMLVALPLYSRAIADAPLATLISRMLTRTPLGVLATLPISTASAFSSFQRSRGT